MHLRAMLMMWPCFVLLVIWTVRFVSCSSLVSGLSVVLFANKGKIRLKPLDLKGKSLDYSGFTDGFIRFLTE